MNTYPSDQQPSARGGVIARNAFALGVGLLACVVGFLGCLQASAEAPATKTEKVKSVAPIRIHGLDLKMLPIPAGSFLMGSPADEPERDQDEKQHRVTITKPFWLGKYPVTQEQYKKLIGTNPSWFRLLVPKDGDLIATNPAWVRGALKRPVEQVTWSDAMAFCKKLNERERAAGRLPKGYEYSLPTEAQWEYACRAGTTTPFSFGSVLNGTQANCNGEYPYGTKAKGPHLNMPTPVGDYSANAWGLHDMHGNIGEWCSDWYGAYPEGEVTDPVGSASGVYRVARGGAWCAIAQGCRSASRVGEAPDYRSFNTIGFRLALVPVR